MLPNFKIAIVHDWLNQVGGAENVLEEMVTLFPEADVYTSIFAPNQMPAAYHQWAIHTSFMQKLPLIQKHHQQYMPIYPLAFRQFHLENYDLVLSNKSGFCHGVITKTAKKGHAQRGAIHVCYCLTPTRFLWSLDSYLSRERFGLTGSLMLRPLLPSLRRWDRNAAQRVDHFVAISREIQARISTLYNRKSTIIYPPVDTTFFTPCSASHSVDEENVSCQFRHELATKLGLPSQAISEGYYLIVSRLVPYKRIDIAVQAFAHLPNERLLIVGDGRDRDALKAMAGDNVFFLGHLERTRVRELFRHCKAFIFPGLEDFGIAPVEAMSAGRPVLAFAGGGALDTVLPGISGELFQQQTADSLLNSLRRFDPDTYQPDACRHQAEKFSRQNFRSNLRGFIDRLIDHDHREH